MCLEYKSYGNWSSNRIYVIIKPNTESPSINSCSTTDHRKSANFWQGELLPFACISIYSTDWMLEETAQGVYAHIYIWCIKKERVGKEA